MPIRGSPNGAGYLRPQAARDRPESVVAINRNGWSQSIGMAGRDRPVRAPQALPSCCRRSRAVVLLCQSGRILARSDEPVKNQEDPAG
jgi:hypothetical protein